jgi:[protein-PII] uridylyltransferase
MARLRHPRIETVVDGVKLRVQLSAAASAAAGDPAEQRRRALEILKGALFRGRMIAKERLEAGAGGASTARLLSAIADEVVTALYDFTTVHVFRARNPTEGERLAVMAVGGYGRGALAPFSDLDLLFLRPYKETAHAESVIEFMLYALWDLGFKVGHASRTVEECLRLSREDFTIRTALLEARRLAGDAALAADLKRRFREDIAKGGAAEFVAAKLKERDERHERAGASRYLVEPNVKESKGGLRDLNTLFWIAQYLHPSDEPSEIVALEHFTGRELKAFKRDFDFLWAVRCHLHFAVGRAEERLSFDLQPEIARRMGYGPRGRDKRLPDQPEGDAGPAVERFMRRYFLIAREVGVLTRLFCAKLETDEAKRRPQGLSRFLPGMRRLGRKALEPGFFEEGGRLNAPAATFEEDPVNLLRIFRIADQRDLDLHPDAFATLVRMAPGLITPGLRSDPEAVSAFLDVLTDGRRTAQTMALMNDSGVLGGFVPEFGRIVGKMQFNMYHSYTVDEHTLRAVGVLADPASAAPETVGLLSSVMPLVADRDALFLAMLLHDTGKGGEESQEVAGEKAAVPAVLRMGLSKERAALVGWLVRHHLDMSDFAQKRDLSDPATVAAFARLVETPERLRSLLALTVADIRAVGPGVFNGWKAQLLSELYRATEAVFRGGRGDDAAAHFKAERAARAALAREAIPAGHDTLRAFADAMEDAYLATFSPVEHAAHHALVLRAAETGAAAAALTEFGGDSTVVAVAARDRRGLFADLAGAIARAGANVIGARVYTSRSGLALDVFHLQDRGGRPFGAEAPHTLSRLTAALEAAGRGDLAPEDGERRLRPASRAAAFSVSPTVVIDNEASEVATVVEASGRDRPGLLEALARTLADAGLTIQSAHAETYGERAVDAFYVTGDGGKLTDAETKTKLKAALRRVLAPVETAPPPRLSRARASAGR